jgi:hypothetical protein
MARKASRDHCLPRDREPESSETSSGVLSDWLPEMTLRSAAQSPRSTSLQRSEQNGRHLLSATHATGLPHVGHSTSCVTPFHPPHQNAHSASSNGTSRSIERALSS